MYLFKNVSYNIHVFILILSYCLKVIMYVLQNHCKPFVDLSLCIIMLMTAVSRNMQLNITIHETFWPRLSCHGSYGRIHYTSLFVILIWCYGSRGETIYASLFVCLFSDSYCPSQIFITHMETPSLPVKGFKFKPMLHTYGLCVVRFFSVSHLQGNVWSHQQNPLHSRLI